MAGLSDQWQAAFITAVRRHRSAVPLRDAALRGQLGAWTQALTGVVVDTCVSLGWNASARWHPSDRLPVPRSEYLALDVMAFASGDGLWQFPIAVFELENSKDDDRIAYSLWKLLCVRADLRVVFCYRQNADLAPTLIRYLRDEVVGALTITERMALPGETVIVVGSRAESETFPYGFFKWWQLNRNTGLFEVL
jgi:hypothetical protein